MSNIISAILTFVMVLFFGINETSDSTAKRLIEELHHAKAEMRQAAAEQLGELHEKSAIGDLKKLLGDAAAEVRATAAWALGEMGDPSSIASLGTLLMDKRHMVQERALRSLEKLGWQPQSAIEKIACFIIEGEWEKVTAMGRVAFEQLLQSLKSDDIAVRREACRCLGEMAVVESVAGLEQALSDPSWIVRREAVLALGKKNTPRAFELLISSAKEEKHDQVLLSVISGLARHAHPETAAALKILLAHPQPLVRKKASDMILRLGLASNDKAERARILIKGGRWEEVAESGKEAVEPLMEALENPDEETRQEAEKILGKIGDLRAVVTLINRLNDPSWNVRVEAFRALSLFNGRSISDILLKELDNTSSEIRKGVIALLAHASDSRAIFHLQKLLQDVNPEIRLSAASALAHYGDQQVAPILVSFLNKDNDIWEISKLLVGLKAPASIPLLIKALEDRDETRREVAAKILGEMKAREAIPALIAAMAKKDILSNFWVAHALKTIGDPAAVEPLLKMLGEKKYEFLFNEIVDTLGALKDKRATGPLLKALTKKGPVDPSHIVQALIQLNDPSICQHLIPLVFDLRVDYHPLSELLAALACDGFLDRVVAEAKNPDDRIRERMIHFLGMVSRPESIVPLIHALNDPNRYIRVSAGISLRSQYEKIHDNNQERNGLSLRLHMAFAGLAGRAEVETLIAAASGKEDMNLRQGAIFSLAEIGDMRAVPPLAALIEDMDAGVREAAVKALGHFKSAESVDALLKVLANLYSDNRPEAALSLGRIGDLRAIAPLIEAFHDLHYPDPQAALHPASRDFKYLGRSLSEAADKTKENSIQALGNFTDPQVLQVLHEAFDSPVVNIKCQAIRVLARRGESGIVPDLIKILDDREAHPWLKNAASDALKTLSGLDAGNDVKAWKEWWEKERKK